MSRQWQLLLKDGRIRAAGLDVHENEPFSYATSM